jgi:hypothetical protein
MKKEKAVIIGGGASGFFCALRLKRLKPNLEVVVLEATKDFLKKVRISGGGRCNVTHNIFQIHDFAQRYPRGAKELLSPFTRFQAADTLEWFKTRGVEIVAEEDGRMFPSTNSSETIINCFLEEAKQLGVVTRTNCNVQSVEKKDNGFTLKIRNQDETFANHLVLATGSSRIGYKLAESLGHKITELAPSLFSFIIEHPVLKNRAGTSFNNSILEVKLPHHKKNFKEHGPLLITHWGLSGPAALKLSAWAAREFKKAEYKAELRVNWLGSKSDEEHRSWLNKIKSKYPKQMIKNRPPKDMTLAFWEQFLAYLEIEPSKKIAELSKREILKVSSNLHETEFTITGKNRFKDEFVECGGVSLTEVNFKTMESKVCQNLYVVGELLDIDGITGGFNFQNAWTGAWIAAEAVSESAST